MENSFTISRSIFFRKIFFPRNSPYWVENNVNCHFLKKMQAMLFCYQQFSKPLPHTVHEHCTTGLNDEYVSQCFFIIDRLQFHMLANQWNEYVECIVTQYNGYGHTLLAIKQTHKKLEREKLNKSNKYRMLDHVHTNNWTLTKFVIDAVRIFWHICLLNRQWMCVGNNQMLVHIQATTYFTVI